MIIFFTEPVKLIGEGDYNIDVMKEIMVTDSYLELDKNVINCQNKEPYFNCTTRHYVKTVLADCGCLPFNMRLSNKVPINCIINVYKIVTASFL